MLTDIKGDGSSDLVQVDYNSISVWFNRAGIGFTDCLVLSHTPFAPSVLNRVRALDIDGTATTDLVYADAGRRRWFDLMGESAGLAC